MRVINYNTIPSHASDTRTMQTIGAMLGNKPERLSQMVTLRPDYTINFLTDGLKNTFFKDVKNKDKFEPIKSMSYEWNIQSHQIPRIKIVEDTTEDGYGRVMVPVYLEQKYFDKSDTFRLENDQQLFVKMAPERISERCWKYMCTLTGDDSTRRINVAYLKKGKKTQYVSNYFPELSERGYHKFMFNVEKHRGYISRHRVSGSYSSDYAVLEDTYMQHGEEYFKIDKMDKLLMDNLLLARNNGMLFGKSNHDIFGKCLDQDSRGRDEPMSDGVITQFSRYSDQHRYNNLTTSVFDDALDSVVAHTGKSEGNNVTLICNRRARRQIHKVLEQKLRGAGQDNAWFYNKDGKKIDLGAEFRSYSVNGNTMNFLVDESLTQHYPDQGYGIFMDTSVNDGMPNISGMTLEGRSMISGTIAGMGGLDGKTSGEIVTSVDGSEKHLLAYASALVANPYAGHIIKENLN